MIVQDKYFNQIVIAQNILEGCYVVTYFKAKYQLE